MEWQAQRFDEGEGYSERVVPGFAPRQDWKWSETVKYGDPAPGAERIFTDAPIKTRRLQAGWGSRPTIKVREWGSWAQLWDCAPHSQTAAGYGH